MSERPLLYFDPVTFADLLLAVELCPVEVSGLASVERQENRYVVSGDIVVFKQVCHIAITEFDPEAHLIWLQEMAQRNEVEAIRRNRLWWHSHVFASTQFSGTDENNIRGLAEGTFDEWWVSMVLNKFCHVNARLDVLMPAREPPHYFDRDQGELRFTRPVFQEDLRDLMIVREHRMRETIERCVTVLEPAEYRFWRILRGLPKRGGDDA